MDSFWLCGLIFESNYDAFDGICVKPLINAMTVQPESWNNFLSCEAKLRASWSPMTHVI